MARKPEAFDNFPDALRVPFGPYMAVVRHVPGRTDGDTFDVTVDAGLNEYPYRVLRLKDVKCEERNTPAGKAAAAFLQALIPNGTPVRVTSKPDPETFGRYVATVEFLFNGVVEDVGGIMVASGHAVRVER